MQKLTDVIATRERSLDFAFFGQILPNPDPILKAQGLDIKVYKDLRSDAHVGGCCRRRKSAVKGLEWGFEREGAGARLHANLEAVFADIDIDQLVADCCEAVFYGYQPIEILWGRAGSLIVPTELRALPQTWFAFDPEAQLRFRTRANPFEGEPLPERKFLLPRQDASYANPYGFPDLSMVFWPMVFKKGGMKFWLSFAEKFGTPWLIGKLPAGTPQSEMDALADKLADMVQDAIAVIPDNAAIDPLEMKSTANADMYEKLVLHCRSEVSIALLGSNQSMEKDSNRASSVSGLEVADDLRDGDAEIVCAAIKQLAGWICDLNGWSGPRPVWRMWDETRKGQERATRDETVTKAGAKLTAAYFQREYGFEDGDLETNPSPLAGEGQGRGGSIATPASVPVIPAKAGIQPAGTAFADPSPAPTYTDLAATRLAADAAPAMRQWLATIRAMLDSSDSLEEFRVKLLAGYPHLNPDQMAAAFSQAFTAADLAGRYDVAREAQQPLPPVINFAATIQLPDAAFTQRDAPPAPPAVVEAHFHVPEQPAPVVNVAAPVVHVAAPSVAVTNEVQPAPVNTVVTHPARAITTVERDPRTLEVTRTITDYPGASQ